MLAGWLAELASGGDIRHQRYPANYRIKLFRCLRCELLATVRHMLEAGNSNSEIRRREHKWTSKVNIKFKSDTSVRTAALRSRGSRASDEMTRTASKSIVIRIISAHDTVAIKLVSGKSRCDMTLFATTLFPQHTKSLSGHYREFRATSYSGSLVYFTAGNSIFNMSEEDHRQAL